MKNDQWFSGIIKKRGLQIFQHLRSTSEHLARKSSYKARIIPKTHDSSITSKNFTATWRLLLDVSRHTITRTLCCDTTQRLVARATSARNLCTPDPKICRTWFHDFLLSKTNTTANVVERSVTAEDTTQLHNATREHFKSRVKTKFFLF